MSFRILLRRPSPHFCATLPSNLPGTEAMKWAFTEEKSCFLSFETRSPVRDGE